MEYPHPYLTISLLNGCNKVCKHCYRTAIPIDHGFKLNEREAMLCLDDASSLNSACLLAGGEPTIWRDNEMDFLSLVKRVANHNSRVAFISNGFVFEDKRYANEFVNSYLQECDLPILMMFTVDFLHENYDSENKRVPFLDNLLEALEKHDKDKCIAVFMISHWTNDERLNIPMDVFEHYAGQRVRIEIDDFMMWGRGTQLDKLSCYVQVGSSDKRTLGPYKQVLMKDMKNSNTIREGEDFENLLNEELLRRLSVCGKPPNFFISWGRKYYYCIPQMGYDWFSISEIGKLNLHTVEEFFARRPVIDEIQSLSIFGVIRKYEDTLGKTLLEEIESMHESIRFAGCSVCLKLSRKGILQKINNILLNER